MSEMKAKTVRFQLPSSFTVPKWNPVGHRCHSQNVFFFFKVWWRVDYDSFSAWNSNVITKRLTWDVCLDWLRTLPHLWQLAVWDIVSHIYLPECHWMSNACACTWMWICAWMLWCLYTSVCFECLCIWLPWGCERTSKREWEKEKERAVVEEKRGKLKLHDEYIGAQSPNREWQSEHRYTVSKQTVRSRGDFPMEATLGRWTPEHTYHTCIESGHNATYKQPLQSTSDHTHAHTKHINRWVCTLGMGVCDDSLHLSGLDFPLHLEI